MTFAELPIGARFRWKDTGFHGAGERVKVTGSSYRWAERSFRYPLLPSQLGREVEEVQAS